MTMQNLEMRTRRLLIRPFALSDFSAWRTAHLSRSAPRNIWDKPAHAEPNLTRVRFCAAVLKAQARRRGYAT